MSLAVGAHLLAVIATLALAWRVLRAGPSPARSWFLPFVALVGWWAVTATGAAWSVRAPWPLLWERLGFVAAALTPVAWFVFVDAFVGRGAPLRPRAALLAAVPLITIVLALLEHSHGWLLAVAPDGSWSRGPWFWAVHVPYGYALMLLGGVTVWRGMRSRSATVRRQLRLLLTALAIPLFGNLLDLAGVRPVERLEWTVVGFTLGAAVLAFAITARRFLRLPPTSYRDRYADAAAPVLFLDADWRVLDRNAAAAALLPTLDDGAPPLGRSLPSVAAALHGGELRDGSGREVRVPTLVGRRAWVTCHALREGDRPPYGYVLRIEPLTTRVDAPQRGRGAP